MNANEVIILSFLFLLPAVLQAPILTISIIEGERDFSTHVYSTHFTLKSISWQPYFR